MAPIEVKSGRDYATHSALSVFVKNEAYRVKHGYVLSNEREVLMKGKLFFFILREPTRRAAPDSGESFLQRKGRGEHFAFDGGMHRPFKAPLARCRWEWQLAGLGQTWRSGLCRIRPQSLTVGVDL